MQQPWLIVKQTVSRWIRLSRACAFPLTPSDTGGSQLSTPSSASFEIPANRVCSSRLRALSSQARQDHATWRCPTRQSSLDRRKDCFSPEGDPSPGQGQVARSPESAFAKSLDRLENRVCAWQIGSDSEIRASPIGLSCRGLSAGESLGRSPPTRRERRRSWSDWT